MIPGEIQRLDGNYRNNPGDIRCECVFFPFYAISVSPDQRLRCNVLLGGLLQIWIGKVLISSNLMKPYECPLEWISVSGTTNPRKGNDEWKQKVYDWLAQEGMFRKEVDDPKAAFHFGINYPVGSPYHIEIVKPRDMKDGLLIVSVLRIAPSHVNALAKQDPEKRKDLLYDLRLRLLSRRPGFSVKEDDGVWSAVQFQMRLLHDSLSKTSLLEAIDEVFRSMLFVIWTFGHHFGVPTDQQQQPGFYA